jgi:hypothetical protein
MYISVWFFACADIVVKGFIISGQPVLFDNNMSITALSLRARANLTFGLELQYLLKTAKSIVKAIPPVVQPKIEHAMSDDIAIPIVQPLKHSQKRNSNIVQIEGNQENPTMLRLETQPTRLSQQIPSSLTPNQNNSKENPDGIQHEDHEFSRNENQFHSTEPRSKSFQNENSIDNQIFSRNENALHHVDYFSQLAGPQLESQTNNENQVMSLYMNA